MACGSRATSSKASLANKKPLELWVNEVVLNKPQKELNHQFHESGMGSRQESRKWEDEYTSFLAPSGELHLTSQKSLARLNSGCHNVICSFNSSHPFPILLLHLSIRVSTQISHWCSNWASGSASGEFEVKTLRAVDHCVIPSHFQLEKSMMWSVMWRCGLAIRQYNHGREPPHPCSPILYRELSFSKMATNKASHPCVHTPFLSSREEVCSSSPWF